MNDVMIFIDFRNGATIRHHVKELRARAIRDAYGNSDNVRINYVDNDGWDHTFDTREIQHIAYRTTV